MNGPPRESRPAGNRAADVSSGDSDLTIIQPIDVLSVSDASRLSDRIRLLAQATWDQLAKIKMLVDQAESGQAHVVLGYAGWTAYLADVLVDLHLHLDRDDRREVVGFLSHKGMSTRAIAKTIGVSKNTVTADKHVSQIGTPAPNATVGAVGKVIGIDGKPYATKHVTAAQTKPPPAQRQPFRQLYDVAVLRLQADLDRLRRLHEDDLFVEERQELRCHDAALDVAWGLIMTLSSDLTGHHNCRDCGARLLIRDERECPDCGEGS